MVSSRFTQTRQTPPRPAICKPKPPPLPPDTPLPPLAQLSCWAAWSDPLESPEIQAAAAFSLVWNAASNAWTGESSGYTQPLKVSLTRQPASDLYVPFLAVYRGDELVHDHTWPTQYAPPNLNWKIGPLTAADPHATALAQLEILA